MNTVRIDANLLFQVIQDGGLWVARCDVLGVTTMGETFEELTESVNDVLSHLFQDLLDSGELDVFLSQHGLAKSAARASASSQFDIPWLWERGNAEAFSLAAAS